MSFLSGSANPATLAPEAKTQETVLPDWYTNYAMQVLANQSAVGARPYETYPQPRIAGFNPDQERAFELTRQVARPEGLQNVESMISSAAGMSGLGAAAPYFGRASSMSGVDAASPDLRTGAGYLTQSTNPTGISLASPFLNAASGRSIDHVGDYMDPYVDRVVDHYGDLAARQVSEKLLPSLTDRFVTSGQFGGGAPSSRFGLELGRGIRDIQADTGGQQAQLLSQGYRDAITAAGGDLSRMGALAGTAGTLGTEQQAALARAGTGVADIGSRLGALTADQQRILAGIGDSSGRLTGQDQQAQLQAAQQMAAVQQQRQQMGITGASALEGVGALQQGQEQKNLDLGVADFLRQQGYDQQQIDAMVKTLQGVQPAVPKGILEQGYGPVPSTGDKPSTLQTLAGAAATVLPFLP